MKRAKIFFQHPDYYIHGTNDAGSMGRAVSHGCIRMLPDDVTRLGRIVQEYGGESRTSAWYRKVIRGGATTPIRLRRPVPMVIEH
jgi:murein L,D-transpeptidase YcbB/YkuD